MREGEVSVRLCLDNYYAVRVIWDSNGGSRPEVLHQKLACGMDYDNEDPLKDMKDLFPSLPWGNITVRKDFSNLGCGNIVEVNPQEHGDLVVDMLIEDNV